MAVKKSTKKTINSTPKSKVVKTSKTVSAKSAHAKVPTKPKPATKSKVNAKIATAQINSAKSQQTKQITASLKNPKVFIPLIIILLAIVLFLLRSWFVVAIVNGQPITRYSFNQQLESKDGKDVLNSMITQTLIFQEASKQHVSVSDAEVNSSLKNISDQLSKQGQTLDEALALRGMTKSDFVAQVKIQKIVEKLLGKNIIVTDADIQDYMDKNKDSLPTDVDEATLKQQIKDQLTQQKLSEKAQVWLQDLQKKAKIQYFVNF